MNNTALEKITKQITITLVVSLLPFIWFFTYLLRGGYATTPIYSVLIVSGVLFMNLVMLLFAYSKIHKNFSTGFLSTYINPIDFNLAETLEQYEKALAEIGKSLDALDKKAAEAAEVDKLSYIDVLDDEITTIDGIDRLNGDSTFKVVTVLLELTKVINLVYFYMFLIFALGLSASLDTFPKSFGVIGVVVTALAMIAVALVFIKAQRNITSETLYNIFEN